MLKFFVLFIVLGAIVFGCGDKQVLRTIPPQASLQPDFAQEFDRLFFSLEPLCYNKSSALIANVPRKGLSEEERDLVRDKLRKFLWATPTNRRYDYSCGMTGVASPEAFLALDAIDLLAEIGTRDDAGFIRSLRSMLRFTPHPLFDSRCEEAVHKLMKKYSRNR